MTTQQRPRRLDRRIAPLIACVVASLTLSTPALEALETEICRVEILIDGRPLTEYAARGTSYIEAVHGREYAIRLTNRTDRRLAVALAVDGLNSIDAKTTDAKSASKWVIGAHESITIEGWQTSAETARHFFFTTEEHSYGDWLGRTTNLGVIEAVVFKEKQPRRTFSDWLGSRSVPSPEASKRALPSSEKESPQDSDDLAATGIGRPVDHQVRRVRLDLEDQPAGQLRIRYEYRPQLVHLGVLPSSEELEDLARRERARGFKDFEFAPDPFASSR